MALEPGLVFCGAPAVAEVLYASALGDVTMYYCETHLATADPPLPRVRRIVFLDAEPAP